MIDIARPHCGPLQHHPATWWTAAERAFDRLSAGLMLREYVALLDLHPPGNSPRWLIDRIIEYAAAA